MRTACNLKFHDSYGAARSDLNFMTSGGAQISIPRDNQATGAWSAI
ncbi:hypothetical protein [uncultured Campylobacter sp.]|nr:hypothetical protein [uncultured Campylobacter sp.]